MFDDDGDAGAFAGHKSAKLHHKMTETGSHDRMFIFFAA
jgi:hypothetical protein